VFHFLLHLQPNSFGFSRRAQLSRVAPVHSGQKPEIPVKPPNVWVRRGGGTTRLKALYDLFVAVEDDKVGVHVCAVPADQEKRDDNETFYASQSNGIERRGSCKMA